MDRKFKKRIIKQVQTGLLSLALIVAQVLPVGVLPATAVAEPATTPSQIAFETVPSEADVDEKVNFVVQSQDNEGETLSLGETVRLYLEDNSTSGTFYSGTVGGGCNSDSTVDYVAIASNSSQRAFCYSNSEDGEYEITVEAKDSDDESLGWEVISTMIIVGDGVVSTDDSSEECVVKNTTQDFCKDNLITAVAESDEGDTLELQKNTSISQQATLKQGMILDGGGYTLVASFAKTDNDNNSAIGIIGSGNVTVKNMTIDGTGTLPWPEQLHGINTYLASDVLVDGVKIVNFSGSGLLVNGSSVTANNIHTSGSGWHGMNIDLGTNVTTPAILTVTGTSTHNEVMPHIYMDNTTKDVTLVDTNDQYEIVAEGTREDRPNDRVYLLREEKDTTPPNVTVLSPEENEYVSGTTTFRALLQDDESGIDAYEVIVHYLEDGRQRVYKTDWIELEGDEYPEEYELEYEWDTEKHGRGDGLYELRVFARDKAGNEARHHETKDRYFYVDNTTPRIRLSNLQDGDVITSDTDIITTFDLRGGSPMAGELEIQVMTGEYDDGYGTGDRVGTVTRDIDPMDEEYVFTLDSLGFDLDDGLYRIRVRAYDQAGNRGRHHRYVYVDNTAPVLSDVMIDGGEVNNDHIRTFNCEDISRFYPVSGDIDVSAMVQDELSDVSSVRYDVRKVRPNGCSVVGIYRSGRVNLDYEDGRWVARNAFDTTDVPEDGEYTIAVTMRDSLGNSTTSFVDILVDNTQPEVHVTSPTTGEYISENFDIYGTAFDGISGLDKVEVRVNLLEDGSFGDTLLPYTEVTVDDEGNFVYEGFEIQMDGVYRIRARAYDKAGNRKFAPVQDVIIDTTNPNQVTGLQILREDGTDVSDGYINTDQRDITITWDSHEDADYDENFKHFEYENRAGIQELTENSFSGTLGGNTPEEGTYTYRVRAVDYAGNKGAWAEVSVTLDLTDPELSVDPLESSLVRHMITISGTASDALSGLLNNQITLRLYRMGEFLRGFTPTVYDDTRWSQAIDLSDDLGGDYQVTAVAEDTVGNNTEESVEFELDNTAPVASITSHEDGDYVRRTITLVGEVEDENPMNTYWHIEGPEGFLKTNKATDGRETHELEWDTTQGKEGLYTIYFETRDKARNKDGSRSNPGDSVAMIQVVVDNTPPVVQATAPEDGSHHKENFRVQWSSDDEDIVRYYYRSCEFTGDEDSVGEECGGFTWDGTSRSRAVSINDNNRNKTFWWQVKAEDKAGNIGDWSEPRFFTLDTEAPLITIDSPVDGATYSLGVPVSGTITDENLYSYSYTITNASDEVVLEGGDTTDEVSYDLELDVSDEPEGEYTLTVTASDKAGNESDKTVTVTIDNSIGAIIQSLIGTDQELSELAELLKETSLLEELAEVDRPLTVFAPQNTAFGSSDEGGEMPKKEVEAVLVEVEDPEDGEITLKDTLKYHIVAGRELTAAKLLEMDGEVLETLGGRKLIVSVSEGTVFLRDEAGNTVAIIKPDYVKASDGVIHVIEDILTPDDTQPEPAEVEGDKVEDEDDIYEPGAKIVTPEGSTIIVTKDGEDYDYNEEDGLTEEGEYEVTVTDEFGRRSSTRTIIIKAQEMPPSDSSESDQDGQDGSQTDQPTVVDDQPQQGGTDTEDDDTSGTSEDDEGLSAIPFGVGGGFALGQGETPSGTAGNTVTPTPAGEEGETDDDDEATEDDETDGAEDGDTEEVLEDNGLVANIGQFLGGWFSTWWGWFISLAVLIFLIFLIIRRKEEE